MVFTGPKGLGRVLSSKQWVLRKMLKVSVGASGLCSVVSRSAYLFHHNSTKRTRDEYEGTVNLLMQYQHLHSEHRPDSVPLGLLSCPLSYSTDFWHSQLHPPSTVQTPGRHCSRRSRYEHRGSAGGGNPLTRRLSTSGVPRCLWHRRRGMDGHNTNEKLHVSETDAREPQPADPQQGLTRRRTTRLPPLEGIR
jgi:hypothetical protein